MNTFPTRIFALFFLLLLGGCASFLPSGKASVESRWQSFDEARQDFEKITPYQTTVTELDQLGFSPTSSANITILTYSDIIRRFIPNTALKEEDLDPGIRDCLSSRTPCQAYEIDHRRIKRKRHGNFWLDFLNFRRQVEVTGWRFNAIIFVKNGIVVYKLWGGQPSIHEFEDNRNPLGPLQGFGESSLKLK